MVGGRSVKNHKEVLEALLAGETLISFLGETARLVDDMVVSDSTNRKSCRTPSKSLIIFYRK